MSSNAQKGLVAIVTRPYFFRSKYKDYNGTYKPHIYGGILLRRTWMKLKRRLTARRRQRTKEEIIESCIETVVEGIIIICFLIWFSMAK